MLLRFAPLACPAPLVGLPMLGRYAEKNMNWPNDADGDVLRRLKSQSFDFSKVWEIDFQVDFKSWPLPTETQNSIRALYPNCRFYDPDKEDVEEGNHVGYVELTVKSKMTYDFVVRMQKSITEILKPFGGWCESWGVMH